MAKKKKPMKQTPNKRRSKLLKKIKEKGKPYKLNGGAHGGNENFSRTPQATPYIQADCILNLFQRVVQRIRGHVPQSQQEETRRNSVRNRPLGMRNSVYYGPGGPGWKSNDHPISAPFQPTPTQSFERPSSLYQRMRGHVPQSQPVQQDPMYQRMRGHVPQSQPTRIQPVERPSSLYQRMRGNVPQSLPVQQDPMYQRMRGHVPQSQPTRIQPVERPSSLYQRMRGNVPQSEPTQTQQERQATSGSARQTRRLSSRERYIADRLQKKQSKRPSGRVRHQNNRYEIPNTLTKTEKKIIETPRIFPNFK